MNIGDTNWNEFCLYVISTPESNCTYNTVELSARRGVGIVQWSYGRSWELLNLYATDYPDEAESHLGSLWSEVKPGSTKWSDRVFNDGEANFLISDTLKQPNMIATQNKLWLRDLKNDYIPLLNKLEINDLKGSIFALSLYHHRPASFYEVYNGVGNGSLKQWYYGALNNGFFGGYSNRQKMIYNLLNKWNGKDAPPSGWAKVDGKPVVGGNVNWNSGNPVVNVGDNNDNDSPTGNYADTSSGESSVSITLGKLEIVGREIHQHISVGGTDAVARYLKEARNMYTCSNMDEILESVKKVFHNVIPGGENEEEVDEEEETPEGGIADSKARKAIEYVKQQKGRLTYSQNGSQRMNIEGGYADCSGLVWWAYRKAGVKNIGTYTGTQKDNGKLIVTIHSDSEYKSAYIDKGLCVAGDIIIFFSNNTRDSHYHVEMIDSDGTLWGINSPAQKGSSQKQTPSQAGGKFIMAEIRRIVTTVKTDKNKSIFLTAGHGGSDQGASGNGLLEKDVNLEIELACGKYLREHGISVKYSRTRDEDDPVEEEVSEANKSGCKIGLSCHTNAGGGVGFEVFYNTSSANSKRLAQMVIAQMRNINAPMHGEPLKSGDELMFINSTDIPCILCECAFLDSNDYKRINTKAKRKAIGEAYAKAVVNYFNT